MEYRTNPRERGVELILMHLRCNPLLRRHPHRVPILMDHQKENDSEEDRNPEGPTKVSTSARLLNLLLRS